MNCKQLARRAFSYQNQLLINGKFQPASNGETFDTFNPATEEKITSVSAATKEDVDKAVKSARKAFDDGPWRRMSGAERGRLMYKLADLIEKNRDELAKLESLDNGKPAAIANVADVQLTIDCYRYYAGWADKIHGDTIPSQGPYHVYTRKEPVGVAGQIIPWNFPMLMQAWKWGPTLASGSVSVLKPAELTSLTALRVGELAMEAGFPEGVVNVVPGYGAEAGEALHQHPQVDKVAFTGSTAVGYHIMRNCHDQNLKRVTLELGGKSAKIIMDDADVDQAVASAQMGLFFNMGQCCIAGSRVFVHEKIYDEFVEKAVHTAKQAVMGDPLAASTTQGPQVSATQRDKILGYINSGKAEGASLLTGGSGFGSKGYFVEPTIFADVNDDMTIAKEEIFGPVMSILKFKDADEVIRRANSSNYGLGAGVVTSSVDNMFKLVNGLHAGTVYVNCYNVFNAAYPFGGFKDSGVGRELGFSGIENYLEQKTVIIKRGEDSHY